MSETISLFPDKDGMHAPAVWTDKAGITHRATGADVHPGIRLLWTKCEKHDIPAGAAWIERPEDTVNCEGCKHD